MFRRTGFDVSMRWRLGSGVSLRGVLLLFFSAQIAVENMRQKREEEEQARELKELEARLQKARTKRQLNEKLKVRHPICFFFSFLSSFPSPKRSRLDDDNNRSSRCLCKRQH